MCYIPILKTSKRTVVIILKGKVIKENCSLFKFLLLLLARGEHKIQLYLTISLTCEQ